MFLVFISDQLGMKVTSTWPVLARLILGPIIVICEPLLKDFQEMYVRPADSGEIFRVNASSMATCIYKCVLNTACMSLVYPDPGDMCVGFRNRKNGTALAAGSKAWRVKGNVTANKP
jgi:hypothetical protein